MGDQRCSSIDRPSCSSKHSFYFSNVNLWKNHAFHIVVHVSSFQTMGDEGYWNTSSKHLTLGAAVNWTLSECSIRDYMEEPLSSPDLCLLHKWRTSGGSLGELPSLGTCGQHYTSSNSHSINSTTQPSTLSLSLLKG